jgi:hypothetical protein
MAVVSEFRIVRFSPVDPDTINVEVSTPDDRLVAELVWGFDGSKVISFGPECVKADAASFTKLMFELSAELDQWADNLRQTGGAWDPNGSYYT